MRYSAAVARLLALLVATEPRERAKLLRISPEEALELAKARDQKPKP